MSDKGCIITVETRTANRIIQYFLAGMDQQSSDGFRSVIKLYEDRRVTGKLMEKSLLKISKNIGTLCYEAHGRGVKKYMYAYFLQTGNFNPGMEYKEKSVFGKIDCFGKKINKEERISFSISHHCFQRILERICVEAEYPALAGQIKKFTYEDNKLSRSQVLAIRSILFDQLEYVPIMSATLFFLLLKISSIKLGDSDLQLESLFRAVFGLTLPIPTKNGLMLGVVIKNYFHIKTFLSNDMLTNDQRHLKKKMLAIFEPFQRSNLIYYPTCREFLRDPERILIEILLDALAMHLRDLIEDDIFNLSRGQSEEDKRRLKILFRFSKLQEDESKYKLIRDFRECHFSKGFEVAFNYFKKEIGKILRNN